MTLLLTRHDLEPLVDPSAAVAVVEAAFHDLGTGQAEQPPVFVVNNDSASARFLVLAAVSQNTSLASTKTFADAPWNPANGLPRQRSLITLFSSITGEPLAILDGRVPTRERTAATSAVATKYLSRENSTVLGLVGAGGLAAPHVRAILAVRPIQTVQVWSRNPDRVAALRAELGDLELDFVDRPSPQLAVTGADIVCTLTPSREPIVESAWLVPGVHVNAVGAPPRPDHREIDTATMTRAAVTVDDIHAALQKSGAVVLAMAEGAFGREHVSRTLAEVVSGTAIGRSGQEDLTLFNSVGTGLQDLAISSLYLERALAVGAGTAFGFSE